MEATAITAAFRRRRIRLRSTAPPKALVTVKPKRGGAVGADTSSRGFISKTKRGVGHLAPPRILRNSDRFFRVVNFIVPPGPASATVVAGVPRPIAAYDPWPDDGQEPSHRRLFPCACGSHGGACAQACWVDTCASRDSPFHRSPISYGQAATARWAILIL